MEEKQNVESFNPPKYTISSAEPKKAASTVNVSKKTLIGVTVVFSVILLAAIILGAVYFFHSTDTLKEVAKMYRIAEHNGQTTINEDIEINTDKNIVTVHLKGEGIEPGTFVVLDYTKSLTGIYDTKERKCNLIGGIQRTFLDPQHLQERLEMNITQPSRTLRYKLAESYPVNDKSFLPSSLRKACAYIPVNWLEPNLEPSISGIQRRQLCIDVCVNIFGVKICYKNC